jgi:fused signal recognition particle receptor
VVTASGVVPPTPQTVPPLAPLDKAAIIADELKLPVKYVGVGEGIDDLIPFDRNNFVTALFKT